MKFIHIADLHLDTNFDSLSEIDTMPEKRRIDQRKALKKVINYIKENNIKYLFISGDLYEQKYIRKSSIEYMDNLFREVPDTKIYIAPGNHDPYLKNSFYNTYDWSENVHIFKDKIERIEEPEFDLYGYGFADYYCKDVGIENIRIENKDRLNILIVHGSLDGGNDQYRQYNPMSKKNLEQLEFDYIALGHIHKRSFEDYKNQRIIYPGSLISLGFDEVGEHGMICVELTKNELKKEFLKIDEREYVDVDLDVESFASDDDIVEKIENLNLSSGNLYKINLVRN